MSQSLKIRDEVSFDQNFRGGLNQLAFKKKKCIYIYIYIQGTETTKIGELHYGHQSKKKLRLKSQSSQVHTLYTSSTQENRYMMMLYFVSQQGKRDRKSSSPEKIFLLTSVPLVVVQKSAGFYL